MKKKGGGCLKVVLIVIVVCVLLIIIASVAGSSDDKGGSSSGTATQTESISNDTSDSSEEQAPVTEHYEVDLSAGHYTAGIDIPAGTYNLTATAGSGNVSSTNMYNGGLNEIMGTPADEFTQETFNNLQLPAGETLSLSGDVALHLVSEDAQTQNMTSRTVGAEVQTDLSAGNYVAGTDFPAGVYNIVSTGTSGNVSSDNMYDGGLNEIIGPGGDNFSVPKVNNVSLPEGTTLTISGTSIQLVPVGQ